MAGKPLYDALIDYYNKGMSSFHTPGHKGNMNHILENLYKLDYTELPETDSLFEASGPILEAEQQASKIFKTESTLFSAGGCTLCIQTMLRLCTQRKSKIICSRIIHKSAINTIALLGLEPLWVYPKYSSGGYFTGQIQADDIEILLNNNKDVAGVYITSPNYYGVLCDVKEISRVCNKYDAPLMVDNAHGAHLGFLSENLHPIYLGASISACSAHKTLPVLTGGAFLNIADKKFTAFAKETMSLFGSTSPSYPIMASLDLAVYWLNKYGKQKFKQLEIKVNEIKEIAKSVGIKFPTGLVDPTRITLDVSSIGISGVEAAETLRKYKVEPEYADDKYVILIATPMNNDESFERLKNAIKAFKTFNRAPSYSNIITKPCVAMLPRKALMADFEVVHVSNAKGRIAAMAPSICPPGIPIVMFGEIITQEIINVLIKCGIFLIKVVK